MHELSRFAAPPSDVHCMGGDSSCDRNLNKKSMMAVLKLVSQGHPIVGANTPHHRPSTPTKCLEELLQDRQIDLCNRFELIPVWAPVEPPAKRAKTAEVRLSSASDVPMPPRSDDNAKGSSDEEASDSSGSNSDVSSQDDSSDVSDLEKFDEAYTDFSALTHGPTNSGTGWLWSPK